MKILLSLVSPVSMPLPHIGLLTKKNTGNSPVADTAANFYTVYVVVATPGLTATTAATHQDAAAHTSAKNVIFKKICIN